MELNRWVHGAQPGDQIVYHRGETAQEAPEVRRAALDLAECGLVALFQRREGEADFSYIATRISNRAGRSLAPCANT